jgi:glycine/D-amino acid oxidase-like deaminating enzyme
MKTLDAIVIGAGFVGVATAMKLRRSGLKNILIVEQGSWPFQRASTYNQSRVHRGYHYPRNIETAMYAATSYEQFIREYAQAIIPGTESYYVIARNSKTSSEEFLTFCKTLNAPIYDITRDRKHHFNMEKIETVFRVEEAFFDPYMMYKILADRSEGMGIKLQVNTKVEEVIDAGSHLIVSGPGFKAAAGIVVNASYSGINKIKGFVPDFSNEIKYELAEIAHVEAPKEYMNKAYTIIDGPYFSLTPRSNTKYHNLSHVTHTPRAEVIDTGNGEELLDEGYTSNVEEMIADAATYMPSLETSIPRGSHYETKVILTKHEQDDGRPMVIKSLDSRSFSILGGKIDSISSGVLDGFARRLSLGDRL